MTYDEPPTAPGTCCAAPCTCQTEEEAAWCAEWNRRPEGSDVSDMFEFSPIDRTQQPKVK